jgi:hypothetical protein
MNATETLKRYEALVVKATTTGLSEEEAHEYVEIFVRIIAGLRKE